MNPEAKATVRETWAQVQAIGPDAAALFYDNLFKADPSLKPLFKGDMRLQGEKLLNMIDAAVRGIDDFGALEPALQQLADRHVGCGVQPRHYAVVGAALLTTLQQGLGDGFTPAVRDAWTQTYGAIAGVMQARH